jgi:NAD(P)-dependent dehydrogenase (short-subunit alcohol dehydrogenase family)
MESERPLPWSDEQVIGQKRGAQVPIAVVTGASRGIGKACALSLARAGFDVAVSARTVQPGEVREHSIRVNQSDMRPLPGSLTETASLVEEAGRRSLIVPMDLLDRASVGAGMATVLERWGTPDLLLHNGRYVGPGQFERLLDTPVDALEKFLEAHAIAPLILTRMVLPGMVERGSGIIMTMSSAAAYRALPAPAGTGGWGFCYSAGKAAGHRLVDHVKAEHGEDGIRAYNVSPGPTRTERNASVDDGLDADLGDRSSWAPTEAIGAVVAWLATSPDARALDGTTVDAQALCLELGLYPSWLK